ncbi:hypothetical protein [Nocardia wallacei]|uniref:hypothetical protein n=1 Tax=Nocardia wallacei TaxID=480035 RepID=UPI002454D913|nr:hypothetical protein [Nocardia wallacei]
MRNRQNADPGTRQRPIAAPLRLAIAAALAVGAAVLGACTGAPNREAEARELETAVRAMPGVTSAYVNYSNDITQGVTTSVSADMHDATIDQIEAVAARVADSHRQDFDEYKRSASFYVGGGTVEHRTDRPDRHTFVSPALVAADARAVRQLGSALPPPAAERRIDWARTDLGTELTLRETAGDSALGVVRSVIGEQPVPVRVFPAIRTDIAWKVDFPFGAEDEARVRAILARSPLPVRSVDVTAGHLARMTVATPDPAEARTALAALIDLVAPAPGHPLLLEWEQPRPSNSGELKFKGSVHVGGCSYTTRSAGEREPEKYYTAEAVALQRHLRDTYDTCPR